MDTDTEKRLHEFHELTRILKRAEQVLGAPVTKFDGIF